MRDKSYLTLFVIHSSKNILRPKDVHVLTLIERLFVPNRLKRFKNRSSLKKILLLLGCQHQSTLWLLTKPGQRQEGSLSNSEQNLFWKVTFESKGHSIVPRKTFLVTCAPFLFHEPLGMSLLWWFRLVSVPLQAF